MENPKVFVIVLNFNGKDTLKKCLESVFQSTYLNKEVIVVDNNSTDGSFEEAKSFFGNFTFIKNNQNVGFAAGNNVAIKRALEKMADYVFLLNNDAFLEKDTIAKLIKEAQKGENIGIVSPVIYKGASQEIWFSGGKINWLKMKTEHSLSYKKTDCITGCAMLIKKSVFRKIGLFDERFFLYYEDADFSYRAIKAGFKLKIVPTAKTFHFEKSSENPKKVYWLVLSGVLFFRKNANWIRRVYIEGYLLLRRIKNRLDVKNPKINSKEKFLVQEAYRNLK